MFLSRLVLHQHLSGVHRVFRISWSSSHGWRVYSSLPAWAAQGWVSSCSNLYTHDSTQCWAHSSLHLPFHTPYPLPMKITHFISSKSNKPEHFKESLQYFCVTVVLFTSSFLSWISDPFCFHPVELYVSWFAYDIIKAHDLSSEGFESITLCNRILNLVSWQLMIAVDEVRVSVRKFWLHSQCKRCCYDAHLKSTNRRMVNSQHRHRSVF